MTPPVATSAGMIETDLPCRLDRLKWSRFHSLAMFALGITWVLDGLEVTLAGSLAGALQESPTLRLTESQIGWAASLYLLGAVLGGFGFGWATDRFGRRRLFFVTLWVYIIATAATAFAFDFWTFALCRFLTGAGIGGEYTAINSAVQEFTPAKYRGRTDLAINGSFWLGAALGALGSAVLLIPGLLPPDYGWRVAFGIGAVLSLFILFLRRNLPESPRWLVVHGRTAEAERIVAAIEGQARPDHDLPLRRLRLLPRTEAVDPATVGRVLFRRYPRRAVLGLILMATQAFFYNAIFFTYALVLGRYYGVPAADIGWFILPFAAANFMGPLLLGPLFDRVGRRPMISLTYALSGILLAVATVLFLQGRLDAVTQTVAWAAIFFFASAAASSAYLTVGECFPLEMRALAIAFFYAVGTGVGGVAGPALFGELIATGEPRILAWGYAGAALLMLIGAGAALWLGEAAERRSLEDVAAPLSSAD